MKYVKFMKAYFKVENTLYYQCSLEVSAIINISWHYYKKNEKTVFVTFISEQVADAVII